MAHDKIYAKVTAETVYASTVPLEHLDKYISEAALLEWLQKEYETICWYREKMSHVTRCVGDDSCFGKAEAYKKVINKIKSL